ncbi:MAG TPA: prolyl oligopeptidase family serine peptidase [Stenotrophomonas sp.]|nr:prolyl oligopeptidase family serine peptidase [Stenotrophomonas sp.]
MQDLSVDDLFLHMKILSLSGHPQHDTLILIASQPGEAKDDYSSCVWAVDLRQKTAPRRLTPPDFPVSSALIAPDESAIAMLSQRGDDPGMRIYLLPLSGGEANRLDTGDLEIEQILEWSSDCSALLATVRVPYAEDALDDPGSASRPIVANFLPYKMDGDGATVGARTHLFRVPLDGSKPLQLTQGDFNVSAGSWSPRGNRLAYSRDEGHHQRHITQLWVADAQGRDARRITDHFALVTGATWCPDGSKIAFSGSKVPGDSLGKLYCIAADGGEPCEYGGGDLHLEGGQIQWHPGGGRLAAICNHRGRFEIAMVDTVTGECSRIGRGLAQASQPIACDDGLAFVSATMCWPDEAYFISWDGSNDRRLTRFNRQWMRERKRPRCSLRRFEVPDGKGGTEKIDAWLLRPPGDSPGPYPVLFDMHGGPQSVALMDYASHVYWYELLARGWLIVAPNSVGSGGYGDEFAKRLQGHWGELDLPQHLAILDQLQAEGVASDHAACAGKSYGGFLSAWAVGRCDRFGAAVVSAPVANVASHSGTSDTGFYVTPYAMGGEIDDKLDRYHALSPVKYFEEVSAAVLLLSGQDDQRCPVGQVEELFARLVRHSDSKARMVIYPEGSHTLAGSGRPSHRRNYHRRIVEWLGAH